MALCIISMETAVRSATSMGAAESARRGDAQAGPECPAAAARIVGHQIVEVAARFGRGQIFEQHPASRVAVLA